jgi:peptidoglycan/xylan/chitin deacetylase (PgdA/CDA1 family)
MRAVIAVATLAVLLAGCGGGGQRVRAAAHRRSPTGAPRRTQGRGRGARRSGVETATEDAALARLRRVGLPVFCGGRHGHLVALTFDDGPGLYTRLALKELRRAHARATFFLVGKSIRAFPRWPRRERRLAALGDHTATHPDLPGLPPAAAAREIAAGRRAAERAAGVPILLFRPPYGARTRAIDREVQRQGMVEVLWDVDSGDSNVLAPQDYAAIARNVLRAIRPGSIVLFHENRGQTIRALRTILPALARRRLRPVTVPRLLAAQPPTPAQLRAGQPGCGTTGRARGRPS